MDSCDSSSLKGPRAPLDCKLEPGLQNLIFVESTYIRLGQCSGRLKMNPSGVKSTFSGGQNTLKFCRLLKFIPFPGSANTSILAFLLPPHYAATRKWSYRPFPFPTSFLTKVAERSAECEQKVKLTVRWVQDNQSSTWPLCAILWLPSWLFLTIPQRQLREPHFTGKLENENSSSIQLFSPTWNTTTAVRQTNCEPTDWTTHIWNQTGLSNSSWKVHTFIWNISTNNRCSVVVFR